MQTAQIISDVITRKIYYDLLKARSPKSRAEFLLALDAIEGGLGACPSGLPSWTEQARAIDDFLGAIQGDYAAGFLIGATGEVVTDPDERESGGLPTAVFRVVLDFKIQGALDVAVRFPQVIGGLSRIVANPGTSQGTVSAQGCRLSEGEIKTMLLAGLSVTP